MMSKYKQNNVSQIRAYGREYETSGLNQNINQPSEHKTLLLDNSFTNVQHEPCHEALQIEGQIQRSRLNLSGFRKPQTSGLAQITIDDHRVLSISDVSSEYSQ